MFLSPSTAQKLSIQQIFVFIILHKYEKLSVDLQIKSSDSLNSLLQVNERFDLFMNEHSETLPTDLFLHCDLGLL